jgi:hypothetical protein
MEETKNIPFASLDELRRSSYTDYMIYLIGGTNILVSMRGDEYDKLKEWFLGESNKNYEIGRQLLNKAGIAIIERVNKY